MNSEQKHLTCLDQDDKNKESTLIKEILSSNVIMQTMIQHLPPCSWLTMFDICKCKKWFNKEKLLNEITNRCLRKNFGIFFDNDKHAINEIMKLLESSNYALVGDFLLHTLQGDSITNCDLTILSKDRIDIDQVLKWLKVLQNQRASLPTIIKEDNNPNVEETLKIQFKGQNNCKKTLRVLHAKHSM